MRGRTVTVTTWIELWSQLHAVIQLAGENLSVSSHTQQELGGPEADRERVVQPCIATHLSFSFLQCSEHVQTKYISSALPYRQNLQSCVERCVRGVANRPEHHDKPWVDQWSQCSPDHQSSLDPPRQVTLPVERDHETVSYTSRDGVTCLAVYSFATGTSRRSKRDSSSLLTPHSSLPSSSAIVSVNNVQPLVSI